MESKTKPKKVFIIYRQECAECAKECSVNGYLLGTLSAFRENFGIAPQLPIVEIDSTDFEAIRKHGKNFSQSLVYKFE